MSSSSGNNLTSVPGYRPGPVRQPILPYRPVEVMRGGGNDPRRLLEDGARTRPYGLNSFIIPPRLPMRTIGQNNEMAQGMNQRFRVFDRDFSPRIRGQGQMQLVPEEDESLLTEEEQRNALNKLKKEVYFPKSKGNRWCLYYRDNGSNSLDTKKDEDSKGCAICLEDFIPREEVFITPCNHMFHESCIVRWVKNNGQCPICRFTLGERRRERRETTFPLNHNIVNFTANDLMANDIFSLISAMEEAFELVRLPR